MFLITFSIIILAIALYKWRKKCKKNNTRKNTTEIKDIEAQLTHPSAPPTYHPQILPQPASIIIKHETFDGMMKQDNISRAIKNTTPLLFKDSGHNILPIIQNSTEK